MASGVQSAVKARQKRRRSTRSCQECRRRKVKCDLNHPCGRCIRSKIACVYTSNTTRTGGAERPNREHVRPTVSHLTPQPRHTAISSLQHVPTSQTPGAGILSSSSSSLRHGDCDHDGVEIPAVHLSNRVEHEDYGIRELNHRLRSLEHLLSSRALDWHGQDVHDRPGYPDTSPLQNSSSSSTNDKRVALNKARLFGPSHWTNMALEFKKMATFLSGETGNATDDEATRRSKSEIVTLLQDCKILAKSMKRHRPSRCLSHPESLLPAMSRGIADQMAQLYVSRFESAFRVLHIPSFWAEYEQYWRNPAKAAVTLQLKVQLVVAVGSSLCHDADKRVEIGSTASQWVHTAQNWLSGPLEKDRLTISGLQIQCLLILARQSLSVGGDLIWVAMGILIRSAMQMGLHRDPRHYTRLTILQSEVRRRIWATILEMNLQASLDAGAPPSLSPDEFDTAAPANVNDDDMDESTKRLMQYPVTTITDTSLQRFLLKFLRPRLEVVRRMNGLGREMSHDEALALTSEMSQACRECRGQVKKGDGAKVETFRYNLTDLLIRRFLLVLHRPFAGRASSNPAFYISRKVSFDAAAALLTPMPNEEFSHLVLLGSGIFKNRMIHVSLALASELLIEMEGQELMPSSLDHSSYRRMLVDSVKEARWQSARRIQLGETNVRLHMKLSIVLSQAEYAEVGAISLQQHMAQSARDSLQMSCSAIQARSVPSTPWSRGDGNIWLAEEDDPQDFSNNFDFDDLLQTTGFDMSHQFSSNPPFLHGR